MADRSLQVTFPDGIPMDPKLAQYLINSMQRVVKEAPVGIDYAELHVRTGNAEFRVAAIVEE